MATGMNLEEAKKRLDTIGDRGKGEMGIAFTGGDIDRIVALGNEKTSVQSLVNKLQVEADRQAIASAVKPHHDGLVLHASRAPKEHLSGIADAYHVDVVIYRFTRKEGIWGEAEVGTAQRLPSATTRTTSSTTNGGSNRVRISCATLPCTVDHRHDAGSEYKSAAEGYRALVDANADLKGVNAKLPLARYGYAVVDA